MRPQGASLPSVAVAAARPSAGPSAPGALPAAGRLSAVHSLALFRKPLDLQPKNTPAQYRLTP